MQLRKSIWPRLLLTGPLPYHCANLQINVIEPHFIKQRLFFCTVAASTVFDFKGDAKTFDIHVYRQPMRLTFNRVGNQPKIHRILCFIQNRQGIMQASRFNQSLLAPKGIGITVFM
jgi:hypothetical protein